MKKERIPGGKSKGKSLKDIAIMHCKTDSKSKPDERKVEKMLDHLKSEFKKGIKTELEHTTDENIAREIAMDHLYEDPKYYTKLSKIEEMNKPKKLNIDELSKLIKKTLNEQSSQMMPHQDHEAKMAKAELRDMVKNAKEIYNMIDENDQLPGWISAYITLASDYMHSVNEYMVEHKSGGQELNEESADAPKKLTMSQFSEWLGLPVDKVELAIEITRMSDADGAYTHLQDMGEDEAAEAVEAIYFEYGSLKEAIAACKEDLGM